MNEKTALRLLWEGSSTLPALRELVQARTDFELELPANYHFALCRHLYPAATPCEAQQIDLSGTADLLTRVAELKGLEALRELAEALAASGAQLRLRSPAPGIGVHFPPSA